MQAKWTTRPGKDRQGRDRLLQRGLRLRGSEIYSETPVNGLRGEQRACGCTHSRSQLVTGTTGVSVSSHHRHAGLLGLFLGLDVDQHLGAVHRTLQRLLDTVAD